VDGRYPLQSSSPGDRFVLKVATVVDAGGAVRLAGVIALTTMLLLKKPAAATGAGAAASSTTPSTGRDLPPSHDLLEAVDASTRGAYVLLLAVLPRYRRNGLGADLLAAAISDVVSIAEPTRAVENGSTHVVSRPRPAGSPGAPIPRPAPRPR
jgi:hypothetical protein